MLQPSHCFCGSRYLELCVLKSIVNDTFQLKFVAVAAPALPRWIAFCFYPAPCQNHSRSLTYSWSAISVRSKATRLLQIVSSFKSLSALAFALQQTPTCLLSWMDLQYNSFCFSLDKASFSCRSLWNWRLSYSPYADTNLVGSLEPALNSTANFNSGCLGSKSRNEIVRSLICCWCLSGVLGCAGLVCLFYGAVFRFCPVCVRE